jgi:hypothetical protein
VQENPSDGHTWPYPIPFHQPVKPEGRRVWSELSSQPPIDRPVRALDLCAGKRLDELSTTRFGSGSVSRLRFEALPQMGMHWSAKRISPERPAHFVRPLMSGVSDQQAGLFYAIDGSFPKLNFVLQAKTHSGFNPL